MKTIFSCFMCFSFSVLYLERSLEILRPNISCFTKVTRNGFDVWMKSKYRGVSHIIWKNVVFDIYKWWLLFAVLFAEKLSSQFAICMIYIVYRKLLYQTLIVTFLFSNRKKLSVLKLSLFIDWKLDDNCTQERFVLI